MKRSRKVTDVCDDNGGEGFRRQPEHRSAAPSMSLIFMDAATNMRTEDLTAENIRKYTLDKYNMDITKHINDLKTMTRSAVQNESKQMPPHSMSSHDSPRAKRKIADVVVEENVANGSNVSSDNSDEQETLESNASSTSNESEEEVIEIAVIPKKNSRKNAAVNSKGADVKAPKVVAKKTSEVPKGKLRTSSKKEQKATKEKAKTTVTKELSKMKETVRIAAKKEPSKLKGTTKSTAKKELFKPKGTAKATAKKDRKK